MNYYIRLICMIISGAFMLYGLSRVGTDAQVMQRNHDMLTSTAGRDCLQRIALLRKKKLYDTIEERVSFTARIGEDSTERIERKGILVRRAGARAVVLICHGFMCNKDDARFLRWLLFGKYTTLSFDFRAHGESRTEQICTLGSAEKEDVIGAVEFIKAQKDLRNKPLIVYGFSMGAVASLLAQAERGNLFDAAIWDCPFDSTDNIIQRMLDQLKISVGGYSFDMPGRSLLQRYAYNPYVQDMIKNALKTIKSVDTFEINTVMKPVDTVRAAKQITIPALFVVCKRDDKAPFKAVESVYKQVRGYKRLWVTNGRCHFDSFFYNPEKYAYEIMHFIENFLAGGTRYGIREQMSIDDPVTPDGVFLPDVSHAYQVSCDTCSMP